MAGTATVQYTYIYLTCIAWRQLTWVHYTHTCLLRVLCVWGYDQNDLEIHGIVTSYTMSTCQDWSQVKEPQRPFLQTWSPNLQEAQHEVLMQAPPHTSDPVCPCPVIWSWLSPNYTIPCIITRLPSSIQVSWLPWLPVLAPAHVDVERQSQTIIKISAYPRWPVHDDVFEHPPPQLSLSSFRTFILLVNIYSHLTGCLSSVRCLLQTPLHAS